MIRFLTAGESHGQCLIGILEGMPAGLRVGEEDLAVDLRRRQLGYGRGERMQIEHDRAMILSGVRYGATLGSPIALMIENRDWPNWTNKLRTDLPSLEERAEPLTIPRPGHADYAGTMKYQHSDIRNVIERSSARETAMRVALGAICRKFFREFGIDAASHVIQIGNVKYDPDVASLSPEEVNRRADENTVRCLDDGALKMMIAEIDKAKAAHDTIGGMCEIIIGGLPVGLGSYVHGDRRLDSVLAAALMSIPAIKSVSVGAKNIGTKLGSETHDRLYPIPNGVERKTNRAGGIEGGVSNGETVVLRAVMKPLSTLSQPLESVDLSTGHLASALRERSDVCAVPAAAVVAEAVCLLALMNPFFEKYGGDSMREIAIHVKETPGSPWA